jgi:hypothetical protein
MVSFLHIAERQHRGLTAWRPRARTQCFQRCIGLLQQQLTRTFQINLDEMHLMGTPRPSVFRVTSSEPAIDTAGTDTCSLGAEGELEADGGSRCVLRRARLHYRDYFAGVCAGLVAAAAT